MGFESVGAVIAKLRKERNIKQEELAEYAGVSAQAVSKWENGGTPDIELLPRIADFFKISVDMLFGRSITDYSNVRNALIQEIIDTEPEKRFEKTFNFCWDMERAMFGEMPSDGSIQELQTLLQADEQRYSSILSDEGFTRMGIANRLQYFLIVPEVSDKDAALLKDINYIELFRDLSDKTLFDALIFLNKRQGSKSFTPNLLIKHLNVDFDKALELIKTLHKYHMINAVQIEMDDVTQEVYNFVPSPSFYAMLIFARELIDKPENFCYYMGGREKPYLA